MELREGVVSQDDAELNEAPAKAPEQSADSPWGRRLLLLVLLLLPAAGGAWVAYSQYAWVALSMAQPDTGTSPHAEAPTEYGAFAEMKNLIVNPAGTRGARYLAVNLGFETNDAGVLKEIETKEVVIRDAVLKQLGEKTVAELTDISRREELKKELLRAVNGILSQGQVTRLYFTRYVLQ